MIKMPIIRPRGIDLKGKSLPTHVRMSAFHAEWAARNHHQTLELFSKERAFSQYRCRSIDVPRLKCQMDAIAQLHVHTDQMPKFAGVTSDSVAGE